MKIGINASFLRKPMTGIGQVTVNFLKQLAEFQTSNFNLQDAKFVLYCQETPQLDFQLPANFEVKVFLPWWKRDDIVRQWLWERQLSSEAAKDGCDVFFSLYQSATVFPEPTRHVMLVHDLIPVFFPQYLRKWSQRMHYRATLQAIPAADAWITPSQTTKNDLLRELHLDERNITVAPLGVAPVMGQRMSPAVLEGTLARYKLTPGYIYHGGGLEVRKNTERVLRAYALIRAERSNVPPLVISGKVYAEVNPLATPVRKLIHELGLVSQVKVLGLVPSADLPALYQGATMFVFPSRYEGFGLPVLEAYAAGTPVVTTQAGSLMELADEYTAMTVTMDGTADELARAMDDLLTHPEVRQTLGERGRQRAASYTWENFTETVSRVLLQ